MKWSAARSDQLFLACLAAVSTYLVIGDFGVRLANTSTDDGLVAYAYAYRYPELFARDAHMLTFGRAALASMLNWLPAVLFKYAELPPEILYWLFTFLQNILLAAAMYRLATVMVGSRESALLSAMFVLAFRPHWWNVGLFADLNWMPYGGWVALPFLLFGAAYALERRVVPAAAMSLIGGLVHPILGLFSLAMIGTFWLAASAFERRTQEAMRPLALLVVTALIFLLPAAFVQLGVEEGAKSEVLSSMLRNGHAIPWANPACTYCLPLFVKGLVAAPVMAVLALLAARLPGAHAQLRLFLAASLAVACAACLLHVIAYVAQSTTFIRLISTRSTILLLAFTVPPIMALAWRALNHANSFVERFIAFYVMAWPSPMALVAALLALPDRHWMRRGRLAVSLAIIVVVVARNVPVIGTWIDAQVLGQLLDPQFIAPLFGITSVRFHAFVVLFIGMVLVWRHLRPPRAPEGGDQTGTSAISLAPLTLALLTPIGVFLLLSSYQTGRASTSGEPREYYEVQAWARSSTAANATFIVGGTSVYEGWRNFTHRAQITAGSCGFYSCARSALQAQKEFAAFAAKYGHPTASTVSAEGLKAFARAYGGDYAVRRAVWPPLDLPIAFRNQTYVVYDLR